MHNIEVQVEWEEGSVGYLYKACSVRIMRSIISGGNEAHIKAIPKLQLVFFSRLHEQALGSTPPATSGATQTR